MTFTELLKEVAPLKSFEDLRSKVRTALEMRVGSDPFNVVMNEFQEPIQSRPWVVHMFTDHAITEWMDKLYRVDYKVNKKGEVNLGKITQVVATFQVKEAEQEPKVEVEITEHAKEDTSFELASICHLTEAYEVDDQGNVIVEAVLIEQGTNMAKRRHYPSATIEEAAPQFKGLKMYINHPTQAEERQRPARS